MEELPTISRLREVDEPLGPLHGDQGPVVTDARFRVVRKSFADRLRFGQRLEFVLTGIGTVLGAVLMFLLADRFGGHH